MKYDTKCRTKSINELIDELPEYKLLRARQKYGENSPEYKAAEFEFSREVARTEAEYQKRKAANQAMLYERGY